jgi:hypothetical protein
LTLSAGRVICLDTYSPAGSIWRLRCSWWSRLTEKRNPASRASLILTSRSSPTRTAGGSKRIRGKFHYSVPGVIRRPPWISTTSSETTCTPRANGEGLAIRDLANHFLAAKRHLVDTGELSARTFADYHATCQRIVEVFGKTRLVADLAAGDFLHLRSELAKTRGVVALGNEVNRVRVVFKFGHDEGLIESQVRYGSSFKRPSRKTLRAARQANGPRMFEPTNSER